MADRFVLEKPKLVCVCTDYSDCHLPRTGEGLDRQRLRSDGADSRSRHRGASHLLRRHRFNHRHDPGRLGRQRLGQRYKRNRLEEVSTSSSKNSNFYRNHSNTI